MSFRTKITLSIGMLALGCVLLGAIVLWTSGRAQLDSERLKDSYEELNVYLELSTVVSRTFKDLRRDIDDADSFVAFDVDEAEAETFAVLSPLQAEIEQEFQTGDRDADDDLEVARYAGLISGLNSAFQTVRDAQERTLAGDPDSGTDLSDRLTETIDDVVMQLIDEGRIDERHEVDMTLAHIRDTNYIASRVTIAVTLLSLMFAISCAVVLTAQLRRPLAKLATAASQFGAGSLHHRILIEGGGEFAALGARFNAMADELMSQRRAVEAARASLERKVAERTQALRSANAELHSRDETRRQFFADIGHELRTPITALRGEAEVALRAKQDKETAYREALEQIVELSGQLTRFVNDIFLIARAQTGFADMRGQTLDLIEEVGAAVEQMRAIASERGSELRMEAADGEAFVEGDRQRLRQLTQILLRNAFEHGKDGVSVVVSVDRIDSEWELAVADDGPGFAAEDLERVFERFYRGAKSARSGSAVGTGLGLPIARSIVLGHGGRIWIDRSAANGAVVRARFPAAGPVPRHAAASPDLGKRA